MQTNLLLRDIFHNLLIWFRIYTRIIIRKTRLLCNSQRNFPAIDFTYLFHFNSTVRNMKRLLHNSLNSNLSRKKFFFDTFSFPWLNPLCLVPQIIIKVETKKTFQLMLFNFRLILIHILTNVYHLELLNNRTPLFFLKSGNL